MLKQVSSWRWFVFFFTPQRRERVCGGPRTVRSQTHWTLTVTKYARAIHPRLRQMTVQTRGLPVTGMKAAFLSAFVYHNESGWREHSCLLWLCLLFREAGVMHGLTCKYELFPIGFFYQYLKHTNTITMFCPLVRTSAVTIDPPLLWRVTFCMRMRIMARATLVVINCSFISQPPFTHPPTTHICMYPTVLPHTLLPMLPQSLPCDESCDWCSGQGKPSYSAYGSCLQNMLPAMWTSFMSLMSLE